MPFKELQERITELERKMGNLLFYGVVIEAKENKVKVAQGDLVTGWIPVFQPAAGTDESVFVPIEKGEMVCVVCPNGSIENGAAIRGMNYNENKIPVGANDGVIVLKLADTEIKFTKNSNEIQISGKGNIKVETTGNVNIEAKEEGNVIVTAANATIDAENITLQGTCTATNNIGTPSPVLTTMTKCPVFGVPVTSGASPVLLADAVA